MADFCRCDGPRSHRAPKRKLGQRRCGTQTTASSNRCVVPWGHAAAQGGFCSARSPVTASHKSRVPGHVSGPVAARSRPPRRPQSQIVPQCASKLQSPPQKCARGQYFHSDIPQYYHISPQNIRKCSGEESAVAVRKSCAGWFL